jgi:hypothetical protein
MHVLYTVGVPASYIKGYFENGTKTGNGTFKHTESDSTYEGGFLNDQFSGFGNYTNTIEKSETKEPFQHIDERVRKYLGFFKEGRFHGNGSLWYHAGFFVESYQGPFDYGKMNGGKYTCRTSDCYMFLR